MNHGGFIDLHSHLLPGIDDGCTSVEESLACVARLIDSGFRGTVCTPHMCVAAHPHVTPSRVEAWAEDLRTEIRAAGLDYELWTGGEVRIAPDTIDWFERHGVPTLGEGRCVLIDYWDAAWPRFADETIRYLWDHGYQPVLAHPERMVLHDAELDPLVDRLVEEGVWLQGNLRCIAGNEGPAPRARMRRWLQQEKYTATALDMHGADDLELRLAGIQELERTCGRTQSKRLLGDAQQEMLTHSTSRRASA